MDDIKDKENNQSVPPTEEPELNDEGQPRPPVDPKNGLYTFLSLLIFAVLYVGYHFAADNLFVPVSQTVTEFTEADTELILAEIKTPLPEGAELVYARLGRFTDENRLRVRCKGITSGEALADSSDAGYALLESDVRTAVFRGENNDMDYVYADVYVSADGKATLYVYEYDGELYGEFALYNYGKKVRSVFKSAPRVRENTEQKVTLR